MALSFARAARVVRRAQLPFTQHVDDPRSPNRRHPLAGILSLVTVGIAAAQLGLRRIEDLGSDLSPRRRQGLGLTRGAVADTTIYELLSKLSEEQFRPVLWHQVRRDLESKAIVNDLFAGGVASYDGKGAGAGLGDAPNSQCRASTCDEEGTKYWDAFALRACLTSSSARPVLDQQYIPRKKNEASTFPQLFERTVQQFPKLFRYVTFDAGLTSEASTRAVRAAGKHYVGGIKANFHKLYPQARQALEQTTALASSEVRAQGKHIRRELRRVSPPGGSTLVDLTELWGVRQLSTQDNGQVATEDRVFAVSIPAQELTDEQRLALVRLHWGIENGPNFTADMLLKEDTQTPCTAGSSVQVLGWLRLLGYNLVSVFRAHLPLKDRRFVSWERSAQLLRDAFLQLGFLAPDAEPDVTLG